MKKIVRCFITNKHFATGDSRTQPPIYELSRLGHTYAKRVQDKTIPDDDSNIIFSFHYDDTNEISGEESKLIIGVVEKFNEFLITVTAENKQNIISNFLNFYNNTNVNKITEFNYNSLITYEGRKYPDFVTFSTAELSCSVWLSDESFKLFYPLYDINVIPPFPEFPDIVKCAPEMLTALAKFNLVQFIDSLNDYTEGQPSTYNRAINVPYRVTWGAELHDCYFGFNIYGIAGDEEYILKEELYDYLNKDLGLTDEFIEEHFPSLFEVNEFFFIPEWENYAIPFATGQGSINSQISKTWESPFLIKNFVKAYEGKKDIDKYMRHNTYDFPYSYNNILFRTLNGFHTEESIQDFKEFYPDIINAPSTHPDYARMSTKTQRFLNMLKHQVVICDANTQTDLFSKIMNNKDKALRFRISVRRDLTYVSIFYDKHRYYMMPRYEYGRINKEIK